jgi:hypothetical protein
MVNETLQYYLSSFVDEERLIPLRELSRSTPYSQEYLSLRARQGKLDAVKIEDVWYSSQRAVKEYPKGVSLRKLRGCTEFRNKEHMLKDIKKNGTNGDTDKA